MSGYSDNYLRVHCEVDKNAIPNAPVSELKITNIADSPRGPVLEGSLDLNAAIPTNS